MLDAGKGDLRIGVRVGIVESMSGGHKGTLCTQELLLNREKNNDVFEKENILRLLRYIIGGQIQ